MFDHLQIYDRRERVLVGIADLALRAAARVARWRRHRLPARPPRRILLLRLERIGDLLMTLDAIALVRAGAPEAAIDLVVGSWNEALAGAIPGVTRVETLDAPWLAREQGGASVAALLARAREWRARRYDAVVNFEGDIRSNVLAGITGAPIRAGFGMAGGGDLLTMAPAYNPREHVSTNTRRLAAAVVATFGGNVPPVRTAPPDAGTLPPSRVAATAQLALPAPARHDAAARLQRLANGRQPILGLHVSGGRAIKQWHPDRFGAVIGQLAVERGAAVVLTGAPGDRPLVDAARAALPPDVPVLDVTGDADLVTLAALIERFTLLVTGDSGPMHLAAAVGTPVVAVFGPSNPSRYAPLIAHHRIVRIDLPCAPCNQIRLPPERCRGHVPDCLEGITAGQVYASAVSLLDEVAGSRPAPADAAAEGSPEDTP